jgi:hypothetical protein
MRDLTHLGRDKNWFVDASASIATIDCDIGVQPIDIEIWSSPTHYCLVEEEIDGNPWYIDI